MAVPVYDFTYRRPEPGGPRMTTTGDYNTHYVGVMGDEAPWAMHHNGGIVNPINTVGFFTLSIQALHARIVDLETQVRLLREEKRPN